jgi:hypothetical protein
MVSLSRAHGYADPSEILISSARRSPMRRLWLFRTWEAMASFMSSPAMRSDVE